MPNSPIDLQGLLASVVNDAIAADPGLQAAYPDGPPPTVAFAVAAVYVPPGGGPIQQASLFQGHPVSSSTGAKLTLDADTTFEIGSTTKVFTTTLILQASETAAGILTQPISAYVGGLPTTIGALPVGHLLSYSSGLPADNVQAGDMPANQTYPYEVETMMGYLNTTGVPVGSAGEFNYSNLGFALAALGVPAMVQSTASYEDLLLRMIRMDSLQMNSTSFFSNTAEVLNKLPRGQPPASPPRSPARSTWPAYDGAGGIVSTLNDLTTWLRFNMGLIPDCPLNSLLPLLQTPQPVKGKQVSYGWFLTHGPNRAVCIWKNGETGTASSYILFGSGVGVVILSNFTQFETFGGSVYWPLLARLSEPSSPPA